MASLVYGDRPFSCACEGAAGRPHVHVEDVVLLEQCPDEVLAFCGGEVHLQDWHRGLVFVASPVDAGRFKPMIL